jgi:hypothetical protein
MQWKYYVTPAFIARTIPGKLEIRRLDNDQWDDQTTDSHMWRMIQEDGYGVSEEEALNIHKKYKSQFVNE